VKTWKLQYCDTLGKWFDELTKAQLKSVAKEVRLLELSGNKLRLPHSKSLGKKLFELRERNYGYRIYYAFLNGIVILLHAGNKKTQAKDIDIARKKLAELENNSEVNCF
jgi:putative addiction module killer protein